jgi:hypothetical protein
MSSPDPNLFDLVIDGDAPVTNSLFSADYDLSYLLPATFLTMDFWSDLLTSTATVTQAASIDAINELLYIRVPEAQSTVYKALAAQMMAYDIESSIMTDAAYDRLNNSVGVYQFEQGRDNFICFLGYVLGMKISLVRLWTEDYVSFFPTPGTTIFNGGTWYPTTHVGVVYANNNAVNTVIPITEAQLTELFYRFAPIELVLFWLAQSTTILLGTIFVQMFTMPKASYTFYANGIYDPNINMELLPLTMPSGHTQNQAYAPNAANNLGFGVLPYETSIETYPCFSSVIIWHNGPPAPTTALTARNPTQTWVFTGVGAGEWLPANSLRYNCDPTTGLQLGILLEPTAFNFVFSSTTFDASPWTVGGSPISIELGNSALDGSRAVRWFPQTGNDSLSQDVFLAAGQYTAQIVFRIFNNTEPYVPLLNILSVTPTSVETLIDGSEFVGPVFEPVQTLNFEPALDIGNGWQWQQVTFTLNANQQVQPFLPIPAGSQIEFFYVGIEDGPIATSFIQTSDCGASTREEDVILLDTSGFTQAGTAAFRFNLIGFLRTQPVTFTADENPVTYFNAAGQVIAAMTASGETPQDTMFGAVANYVLNQTFTSEAELGSQPNISLSWNPVAGGNFSLNNTTNSYPTTALVSALTRIGPGWHGHLTDIVAAGIAINAGTIQNIFTGTDGALVFNNGQYFGGW